MRSLAMWMTVLLMVACAPASEDGVDASAGGLDGSKADQGTEAERAWANGFFLTQIQDDTWNPDGTVSDKSSNNCGPASLAMLMAERGVAPAELTAEQAIDHARAMMYPDYPEIDDSAFPEGASLYDVDGAVCVDDDTHAVYFDLMDAAPSVPRGILNAGGEVVVGSSWAELDNLLETYGSVIAYGHITGAWGGRFGGSYGEFDPGPIPHFIVLLPAATAGEFVVCDPMNRGGAVVMSRSHLQTFFASPVNVYETSIRLIAWDGSAQTTGAATAL